VSNIFSVEKKYNGEDMPMCGLLGLEQSDSKG
jgi:hypothetical protein